MTKRLTINVPPLWDVKRFGKGVIAEWLKKEGANVRKGDILCIIMAAKVRIEIPSPIDGTIVKIIARKGSSVSPGDPLAEVEVPE